MSASLAWFWFVIHCLNVVEHDPHQMGRVLDGLSDQELITFERQVRLRVRELGTSDLERELTSAYSDLIGDDSFEAFRTWIVFHGQDRFNEIRNDPSCVSKISSPEEMAERILPQGEDFSLAVLAVWMGRGADRDQAQFEQLVGIGRGERADGQVGDQVGSAHESTDSEL